MRDDKLVEAMARAIKDCDDALGICTHDEEADAQARAVLDALQREGWVLVPRARLQSAHGRVHDAMNECYQNAYSECCGRAGTECCGEPEPAWSAEDQRIMGALAPVERALFSMIAAAPQPEEAP